MTYNPHYDFDKLGWEMIELEQPDMSYKFNYLCFWKTPGGLVLSASDSGCSCPSPFEDYCGDTAIAIEQKLERVGSVEQAKSIIDAWNEGYDNRPYVGMDEVVKTLDKIKGWLISCK